MEQYSVGNLLGNGISGTNQISKEFSSRALFSDTTANFIDPCEPEPGGSMKVRLRVARGDTTMATLAAGEERYPMQIGEQTDFFDYYECTVKVSESGRFTYYFIIWNVDGFMFYNRKGLSKERNPEYDYVVIPGFKTPKWAKGAVMYQIFVDRFCNSVGVNGVLQREYKYNEHEYVTRVNNWYQYPSAVGYCEFYGGDLQGVRSKLDYLQELGIEVIYFNPIFVSPSNHKYDTQDYYHIDPHFAVIRHEEGETLKEGETDNTKATRYINAVTNQENLEESDKFFADLVEEIHRRGMKVILDGVFNHCGSFNKWMDRERIYKGRPGFENGAYYDENSPYRKYFTFTGEDAQGHPLYNGWWGNDTLPKLNYEQAPELEDEIMAIARKWVSPPYNADGWRLDVAADLGTTPEYNHKFWKRFRKEVKEANPEALILAEHYGDASAWLSGDQWDSVMNYDAFMEPFTWFLTGMQKHSDEFRPDLLNNIDAFFGTMEYNMRKITKSTLDVAMNELSNHDHSRFLTRTNHKVGRTGTVGPKAAEEDIEKAVMREAVMIQLTWPGAPTIYYGDEAGLCGWTDPDNRRSYPWGNEDFEMIRFHRELIRLRKSYGALKTGSLKFLVGRYGVLSYGRFDKSDKFVIAINNTDEEQNIEIPVWEIGICDRDKLVRLIRTDESGYFPGAAVYHVERGIVRLRMPKKSGIVIKDLKPGLS